MLMTKHTMQNRDLCIDLVDNAKQIKQSLLHFNFEHITNGSPTRTPWYTNTNVHMLIR